MTLEGNVVDGDHRLCPRAVGVVEVDRGERRLPVVGVDDRRDEGRHRTAADIGCREAQRRETLPIVRPVAPVRSEIGVARAIEEKRCVEDEQVEPRGGA